MFTVARHCSRKNATFISGVLAIITMLAWSPVAGAIESANIGALPANPRSDNPRTKSIFVFEAAPQESVADGIKIVNNSNETKAILVYPVDAQRSSDGAFACTQRADEQTGVGAWIALAKTRVTLAPHSTEVVPFTLTMPARVDVGEHNGCIAVQEDVPAAQSDTNGIVLSFRSALRVAVVVPGDIMAKLQFQDTVREVTADMIKISPVVQNNGNVSVDAAFDVKLVNLFGAETAKAGGTFVVLRDQESRFNFEIDRPFWGGLYRQQVSASYTPLRADMADAAAAQTVDAETEWMYVEPTPVALLLELIILAMLVGGIGYIAWRRRQQKNLAIKTTTFIVERGDNIQSLAADAGVHWRRIATLNHLKPPYTIRPGQKIKVPQVHEKAKRKKSKR